jgi:hypothetical protein
LALLLQCVRQSRAHWLRFYADAKVVAGFSPPPFAQKTFATSTTPTTAPTKAAAKGVGARGRQAAASKGLNKGLVGLAFAEREPVSCPLVALFCRRQSGRQLFATITACPKNLSREHTPRHPASAAASKGLKQGVGWPCSLHPLLEPASHPLVALFCRPQKAVGFSPRHHLP